MIRIAVLGDIGSGKSYVAKQFGYPVFNADVEIAELYKKNRKCYNKLKKIFPEYIVSFPIKKTELIRAIIAGQYNLRKIIKIVHPEIRFNMNNFVKKNKHKRKFFGKKKLFYDVIYNPGKTNFLLKGEELGNEITNGKIMFICQAQLAFRIWHNILPKINNETVKLLEGQTSSLPSAGSKF